MRLDYSRDANLSNFAKALLKDRYLLPEENFQELFARTANHYGNDDAHRQRLYDYQSKLWLIMSTPILSNGGTARGLPISCFVNETDDSLEGIVNLWNENVWLASSGGGIGSYWGHLRSMGEPVRGDGKTSGIIPFISVQNALTLAISQGSLRRGSSAVYLPVWHPEIEEFINIRKPTGGDYNRKALNLHHGIIITDSFMHAVAEDLEWPLLSPRTGDVIKKLPARDLWIKILDIRIQTGEPYLLFIDNVNKLRPETYKKLGLKIKTSNLCSEIVLATGKDHLNEERTAVCCLASVNLELWDEWKNDELFIYDIMLFLKNVLKDFRDKASKHFKNAVYSCYREESVGLGVMGQHFYFLKNGIPFESLQADELNKEMFRKIRLDCDNASKQIAEQIGPCPDSFDAGTYEAFTHKMTIAPTASTSIIGNTSPAMEPSATNCFVHKTLSGSFHVKNKYLISLLEKKGLNNEDVWVQIMESGGSIQHLDFFTTEEKNLFKTAYEIDQRCLIKRAADRTPFICQSQSVNLFLKADIHKRDLHELHFDAWKRGLKSLYYARSQALNRTKNISSYHVVEDPINPVEPECEACQ